MKKITAILTVLLVGILVLSGLGVAALNSDIEKFDSETIDYKKRYSTHTVLGEYGSEQNNTLITEHGSNRTAGRIIEVDSAGNIIWEKTGLSEPMDAERLSNGNTLIAECGANRVIEINSVGSIVWQKTGLSEPMDAERLSNGNTLIAECGANRIIKVDNAGNIIWEKTGLSGPVDVERLPNQPPSAPDIDGPTVKPVPRPLPKVGEPWNYTFKSTDPEGENVSYFIDWDDGDFEDWFGPFESGEEVIRNHTWDDEGTYNVRAKAKDIWGAESEWGTLDIIMPKSKQNINPIFFRFLLGRFF